MSLEKVSTEPAGATIPTPAKATKMSEDVDCGALALRVSAEAERHRLERFSFSPFDQISLNVFHFLLLVK